MLKHIGFMAGMLLIALLVFYFAVPFEAQMLDSNVSTGPEITLDAWIDLFRVWAAIGIVISVSAALLWFALGQWVFSMNQWTTANNKRTVWFILGVVALAAALPGMLLMPAVEENGSLTWPLFIANNLAVFYLSTLLLSPSSFKYTPVGGSVVRPLRQWL